MPVKKVKKPIKKKVTKKAVKKIVKKKLDIPLKIGVDCTACKHYLELKLHLLTGSMEVRQKCLLFGGIAWNSISGLPVAKVECNKYE